MSHAFLPFAFSPIYLRETVTRQESLGPSREILGLHFAFSLSSVYGRAALNWRSVRGRNYA